MQIAPTAGFFEKPAAAYMRHHRSRSRIRINNPKHDRPLRLFLLIALTLATVSLLNLNIQWMKIVDRAPKLGEVVNKMFTLDLDRFGFTATAFAETVSVTVLATIYSMFIGILFGALAARNITPYKWLPAALSGFFSFVRAVPTTIWVLLMLVCLGFGPAPGIAGLMFHAIAFFAYVFAQCFEEVPDSTIEALKAAGATRLQIFFGAILPASLSPVIAWVALRFEINFGESTILGMVGAGGIGYTIMASMSGYKFGRAGIAVVMVFAFAYVLELVMTKIRKGLKV